MSLSTVSRVINGGGRVAPHLQDKVRDAVAKLGYRPHPGARSLRTASTKTFGIVFNSLGIPGQLDLFRGVGQATQVAGFKLLAADARGDHSRYVSLIKGLCEERVDGLFLVAPADIAEAIVETRRFGIPVMALLARDSSLGDAPLVAPSERRAFRDAISRLVELGHRQIGYILTGGGEYRGRLIEEALRLHHLPASRYSTRLGRNDSAAAVNEITRSILSESDRPTALIVHIRSLPGVLTAVRELSLVCPDDISVVSVGDSPWHELLTPSVSVIRVDDHGLGQLAGDLVLKWIKGERPPRASSLLAEWVERGSVGPVCE